jgi:hypothetical protein
MQWCDALFLHSDMTLWGGTFSAVATNLELDNVKMLFPSVSARACEMMFDGLSLSLLMLLMWLILMLLMWLMLMLFR